MKAGMILATAKSKSVVQDATLRGLGTTIIGAGLLAFQGGTTLQEKALGAGVMLLGLVVFIIKDIIKSNGSDAALATKLGKVGKAK